jgi:hypothetical protein
METTEMYKEVVGNEDFNDVPHITMVELRDAVNTMAIANRLPECYWEQIKHNNICGVFTTLWQLTGRYLKLEYPEVIGIDKPSQKFLKWIYNELVEVKLKKGVIIYHKIP